ncbi:Hypothetical predicted protein [Mytilus galloprovincialis]|uniref:IRG-type G domain-containing protein n=1 Tax=Mytilus galloprovincialis TaxID=29158 RepID=A0A8B6BLW4_MYTGA|nr:Hypothetical predicted protein [Mytilus galloprovincialis]
METSTYIRKKLAEVKTMILKFAVIGRSAVGKSSFINMMLDLQPGNTNYAETGAGDTTKNAYIYYHPQNENITFWDMPGFGTMEMTVENFSNEFGSDLNTFDYFFIFIDTVIMEGDLWLVEKIKSYGTPYCFVRSKLDEDIKKGRTKEEIRQKLERSIQANSTVKGSALFLISNEKSCIYTGDLRELFSHITKHLPLVKADSLAFFLPILTPEMIEQKFEALLKRIKYVAFKASFTSGILIHSLANSFNIRICGKEIEEYYRVLVLDKDIVLHVPGVKHRKFSENDIKQYVTTFFNEITHVERVNTMHVPTNLMTPSAFTLFAYKSIVAGTTVYKYARQLLIKTLMEMTADAHTIYDHYTKFQ